MSLRFDENGKKIYSPSIYVQKYYEELFTNLLEEAYDNSLISHNELFVDYVKSRQDISSYYVMTLSIIADTEEDIYYDMTDVYYSDKIEYAVGDDLDDIGMRIGCPRPQATKAGVELVFTLLTPAEETQTIPANTFVSTNGGIEYYTVEDADIPAGETEVSVYALSVEEGMGYRVASDTLTYIISDLDFASTVTNPQSASGGSEIYNDEDYRKLLLVWVKNNIKGSKEAFERYFAYVDGIDGYKLIPNWDVSGTLKIVIDPGYPYQLKECYDEIMDTVCQLPDDITMFSPERVNIDIHAVCNVDIDEVNPYSSSEKESIKTRIVDAIKLYIDGDYYDDEEQKVYTGLNIGEDFVPYKLGVFIHKLVPELKNITFNYPSSPVTITEEEKGVSNEINIEME